jgi:hypothetical protein
MDTSHARTLTRIALLLALVTTCGGCSENIADVDDTTPLEVASTVPINGGIIAPTDVIRVTFSKDVDASTVEEGVQLIGVAATVTYDAASRTATLTPKEPLMTGRAYTVVVSKVTGLDGSRLKSVYTVSFVVNS